MDTVAASRGRRWRALLTALAIASCSSVGLALFTNGGFEDGTFSGWTKSGFVNPGLSGPPFTYSSINMSNTAASDWSTVVGSPGGGPLSIPVAETGGALMVPRFGDYAAVVNYPGANYPSRNANVLKQSTFVQQSDVDALDGKVHVKLAFAPVLSDGSHSAASQAFFYLIVRNKSRGDAVLYETFAYANQPGVPWQTSGGYTFTDWQVADIAPGNASLAVGDELELEAVAAGCSAGGHAGWVYVDAFGSLIPGPSIVATAPSQVNASSPLTYTLTARNQGTGALSGGVATFTVPTDTTFASLSDPGATCSHTGATVTCQIGTLAVGGTYTFGVTVDVGAVANGTVIAAGNYSIEGTGEAPLLGPLVNTTVSAATLVDLAMVVDNGVTGGLSNGQSLTYTITAQNLSGGTIVGATVTATPPGTLVNVSWTCVASAGGTCGAASGTGAISDTVTLASAGTATYTLTGTVSGLTGTLSMAASVAAPAGATDQDPSNNSAADNDVLQPNTPPVAGVDSYGLTKNGTLTVDSAAGVLANDVDGDGHPLSAVHAGGPAHGSLTLSANGSFIYVPTTGYVGADSFTYVATDGIASSGVIAVTLTVVNGVPTAIADSYAIGEDGMLTATAASGVLANDADADGDPVVAALVTGPAHGVLTLGADGSFTYTPTANYNGPDAFTYQASDGDTTSAVTTVTINVTAVNDAPTIDQPANVAVLWSAGLQTITVTGLGAGGGEGDPLSLTAVSGTPSTVVVSPVTYGGGTTATFTVTPMPQRQGAVTVTVAVSDGLVTVQRTFTVTVSAPPFYVTHLYPSTGPAPGGVNIRLYGGGFLSAGPPVQGARLAGVVAPTVLINGVLAPAVVVESDNIVSAITPPLPEGSPLDVQLILPGGQGVLPLSYTPYAPQAPASPTEPTDPTAPAPDPTNPMDPTAPVTDTDGDGMTDVWEAFYGTDPSDATDAAADPDGDGHTNKQEFDDNTHPAGTSTRYFAEGNAAAPFRTWLNMYNPSAIEAAINVTFYLDDATVVHHLVKAAGSVRTTVDTSTVARLHGHAFGMRVDADEDIVINRTITWNEQGAGAAAERGVELSPSWYFAEGTTHPGLETFVLLTNPAEQPVTVEIEYLLSPGGARVTRTHGVPAHARHTVWVNQEGPELQDKGFGLVVRATHPIVAERATYITSGGLFDAGETSVGAPAPGLDWYFAEGVAGPDFDTFLLLANPSATDAEVQVRYLPEAGAEVVRTYVVGSYGRVTVPVDDESSWEPRMGFGMQVHVTNSVPIVAERAMWWSTDGDSGWEEGHGSAGSPVTGTSYAIGDGVAGGAQGASTYLLLANPGTTPAQVRITMAFEDGTLPLVTEVVVEPSRRLTVDVATMFPAADGKRFSARLDSLNVVPIVVEQSMYWMLGTGTWITGVSLPATRLP